MARRCAAVAIAIALTVTLGVAIAHAHLSKTPDSAVISLPREPASPGLSAAGGLEAVAMKDWTAAFENAEAPANLVRKSSAEIFAWMMVIATPRASPPLLDRPPPSNS